MEDTMTKAGVGCRAHLQESFFLNLFLQSGYHLPRQLWLQPPNLSGRARFWGFSTSPGFNLPPQPSTAPKIEHNAQFWGFSTPQALTSFHDPQHPRNRARCSVWGVFDLPGLRPPSTTLDNRRNRAQCLLWGVFNLLGFNLPQQPPKPSVMLGFGGFRPPWASSSLDNPRNRV